MPTSDEGGEQPSQQQDKTQEAFRAKEGGGE